MGKKSKRKNPKKRKEELQERRERIHENIDCYYDSDENDYDPPKDQPIYVGDRVWYTDLREEEVIGDSAAYLRCVVKKVDSGVPDVCTLLPVNAKEGEEDSLILSPKEWLLKDTTEWTLRFKVGDKVACRAGDMMKPAIIAELYRLNAPEGVEVLPVYKCLEEVGDGFDRSDS